MEHLRPRGFTELIDAAFQLLRARFGALATASALVTIPVMTVSFALLNYLMSRTRAAAAAGSTVGVPRSSVFPVMIAGYLISFVCIVFGLAVMIHVAAHAYLSEPAELGAGIARARQRFRLLLLTALGKYGMVVGCVMIAVIIMAMLVSRAPDLLYLMVPAILVLVAFMLVRWSMSGAVILLEEPRSVGAALDRSIVLTRGGFLRLTGVFGVALGIAYAASLALTTFGMSWLRSVVLLQLLNSLVWFAIYPFLAALVAAVYYDLRIRNEGLDLELMAGGLEPTAAPASTTGEAPSQLPA